MNNTAATNKRFLHHLKIFGRGITQLCAAIHDDKNAELAYDIAEDLIRRAKRIEKFRASENLSYPPHVYNIALYATMNTAEEVFKHLRKDVTAL